MPTVEAAPAARAHAAPAQDERVRAARSITAANARVSNQRGLMSRMPAVAQNVS
jgi:hypothetical protein